MTIRQYSPDTLSNSEKERGWSTVGKEIEIKLVKTPGSGSISFTQTEFKAKLESGIYYAEYNGAVGAVEVGVTTDLNGNSVSFRNCGYGES